MKKLLQKTAFSAAALLCAAAFAAQAQADIAPCTANLTVKVTLKQGCAVSLARNNEISFGTLSNLDNAKEQFGSLTINCSGSRQKTALAKVALDSEISGSRQGEGTFRMKGERFPQEFITYYVYKGASGHELWGKDGAYRYTPPAVSANGSVTMPFRVALQSGQKNKPDDTYSDRLVATLIYN